MAKNGENLCFTGERMVLCNRYNSLAHFGKIKKNPWNSFFAKSQKPRNDVKFASDVNILNTNERFSCKPHDRFFYNFVKMSKPFFGTFWQNFNKIVGVVFSQSLKNPEMMSNLGFLLTLCHFSAQRGKNSKKRPTFEPLLSPNFIPNFGKNLGAVF